MRIRLLEEDARRVLLALWAYDRHDEAVEATPPAYRRPTVTEPKIKTCPSCGATGRIGGMFYESNPTYCKVCTVKKINDHIHRVNEATRDHAENHRQPWSELEVETLLMGVAEGMSGKDLAELLGRTYLAVHGKIQALRKLMEEGRGISHYTYEIKTTTTTTITARPANICPNCQLVRPCFCD